MKIDPNSFTLPEIEAALAGDLRDDPECGVDAEDVLARLRDPASIAEYERNADDRTHAIRLAAHDVYADTR